MQAYSKLHQPTGNMENGFNGRAPGNMYERNDSHSPYPQTPTGAQQNAAFTTANALNQALTSLSIHGNGQMPGPGMSTPMSGGPMGLGHPPPGHHPHYSYMPGGAYMFPFQGYPPYATMPRQGVLESSAGNAQMPLHPGMHHPFGPPGLGHGYPYGPLTPQHPSLGDLPGLENRRSSSGSKEDPGHSSSPDTPYLGAAQQAGFNGGVGPGHASPRINYGYETPSPPQYLPAMKNFAATDPLPECSVVGAGKIIPPPVMAGVFPPGSRKPLSLCLLNANDTKNVYIRGLHPTTSDEMLLAYGSLFGIVESAKAIIEAQTGDCKGFGFLLYFRKEHAERCIRDFYSLGYEASFARESFNHTLKSLQDPHSSNLYFSNLPKSMNESELDAILVNYEIESTRILRDPFGNSRGVGFARLKNRYQCDEVIKTFNGHPVGEEGLLLQVRYADTEPQRHLKKETQQRRDYRSKEHNLAVYGSPVPRHQSGRYNRFATLPRAQSIRRVPLSSSLGGNSGEAMAKMMERSDDCEKKSVEDDGTGASGSSSIDKSASTSQKQRSSPTKKKNFEAYCVPGSDNKILE